MNDKVAAHIVCKEHMVADAIPYRLVIEPSCGFKCDKCDALAIVVLFTKGAA